MFVNKTVFKRLLKEAYNNNRLRIGDVYGGIAISSGYWKLWCREGYIPNWFKASVIELIGEFPDVGTVVEYGKGEVTQQVIADNEEYDLHSRYLNAREPYTVTPVVFEDSYAPIRFLQKNGTKEIIALQEKLYQMIDFSNMEKDEMRPAGPSADKYGYQYYWANEHCVLELFGIDIGEGKACEVAAQLEGIDFEEAK